MDQLHLFSPEATHANRTPLQAWEEARKITVSSGRKCTALPAKHEFLGLLTKMLVEALPTASLTSRLMTWKTQGTRANRIVFQLSRSGRYINGKEFGLSLITPTSTEVIKNPEVYQAQKDKNTHWKSNNTKFTSLGSQLIYGLNIDGCRVDGAGPWFYGNQPKLNGARYQPGQITPKERHAENVSGGHLGRWPANIIHDGSELIVDQFPESKGQQGRVGPEHGDKKSVNTYGDYGPREVTEPRNDSGSAARFFYCAKISPSDRNEGLPDGLLNDHPTVKPTDLMRYLIRLVTPRGGLVLDPFRGSGSTGKAAMYEHMRFVGIDMDEKWELISKYRIEYALQNRDNQIKLFEDL